MARIRTVKPALFKHEGLYDLERETNLPLRLAFIGLFTCCDREGRFAWRPRALKLDVLPYDDDTDFSRVLDALWSRGFVLKYEVDGELYGLIPTFAKHQVINNRESESEIPTPQESSFISSTSTRTPRVSDTKQTPLFPAQGEREGKGREEEREKEGKDAATKRVRPQASPDRPAEVSEQVWKDWLELRRKKSAPVTQTVLAAATDEARKAGVTLQGFLEIWCLRGSQGLQADWLKPHEIKGRQVQSANSHTNGGFDEPRPTVESI